MQNQKNQKFLVVQPSFNNGAGYTKMSKEFSIRFFEVETHYSSHPFFHFRTEISFDGMDRKYFQFSKGKSIELKIEFYQDLPDIRELETAYKQLKVIDSKVKKLIAQGYQIKDFKDVIFLLKMIFKTDKFYSYDQKAENNVREDTYQIEEQIRRLDDTWDEKVKECFPEDNAEVAI
jgi:hypothetical protein